MVHGVEIKSSALRRGGVIIDAAKLLRLRLVSAVATSISAVEMSGNIFFNPIPSHSQWLILIRNPKFSLVLFPFPSHTHWLFPFTPAPIPVLLVVSRSDNK